MPLLIAARITWQFAFILLAMARVFMACDASLAALGDSEAELRDRYGEPRVTQPGGKNGFNVGADKTMVFVVQEPDQIIEVQVGLVGGESVVETYFFSDAEGEPRPLTRAKAERYLMTSAQGNQWAPLPAHLLGDSDKDGLDDFLFVWTRSDSMRTTAGVQRNASHGLKVESAKYKVSRDAAQRRGQ